MNIQNYMYDYEKNELIVLFGNGNLKGYPSVKKELFEELVESKDIDEFFKSKIITNSGSREIIDEEKKKYLKILNKSK